MRLRPVRLSIQLASIIALIMLVCAALIVAATIVFDAMEQARLMRELSPEAQKAVQVLIAGKVPDSHSLSRLVAEQQVLTEDATLRSNVALAVFTFIAAVLSFVLGVMLIRPIGRRLDSVARASQTIAAGQFGARVETPRLASIEERKLIRDFNRMAESLAEAEREMHASSAAIAHELRTPLTVLKGRLLGIQDGVFEAGPQQIASLLDQVEMLVRIVEDLRTLVWSEFGGSLLDPCPMDLAAEVRSALAAIEPDLRAAGLEPETEIAPAPMVGDPARLRQVLVIALTNVMSHAPGSGALRIVVEARPAHVALHVLDRGPGLTAEGEARAFERFWRAGQDRRRGPRGSGSGLGLPVARAIVEAHGGTVRLVARQGGGAHFEVILPRSAPDQT